MKGGRSSHSKYTRVISKSEINNYNEDCDNIVFDTDLQKIQSSISNYKKDDCLILELDIFNNILVKGEFGILGYITSIESMSIINCLINGKNFKAIILDLDSTFCRVRIRSLK